MKKHGASHGAAVMVCTVASALLVDIVRKHVPVVYKAFDQLSVYLVELLNINYPPKYLTILIYATILAVIWGIGFSFMHSD